MRRLSLALLALAVTACDGLSESWPYEVTLTPGPRSAERGTFVPCQAYPSGRVDLGSTRETTLRASDFLLSDTRDLVRVRLDDGDAWVAVEAPLRPADRVFLLSYASESCGEVLVEPFADGRHVILTTTELVMAVDLRNRRVRELDQVGATLEGCHHDRGREELVCNLDLDWGEVHIDADGEVVSGDFRPRWQR
ncbi:MAG: hypothetical protein KC619_36005 [Myxococcales bacterium]|nr:hypothetical protein [Myxococcales bacterium]